MRHALTLLVMLAIVVSATAHRPDTLSCHYDHRWSLQQCFVPGGLILLGAVVTATPALHTQWDMALRDNLQADGHPAWRGDNYLQYLPAATPFVLNLCGVRGQHTFRDLVCLTGGTYLVGAIFVNSLKYTTRVERPYGDTFNSFPSGHTFTAFAGAEILRREYGKEYPLVAIAGYGVATSVGLLRIYNNNHWASDVLAGAGFGILSASIAYWLAPYLRF